MSRASSLSTLMSPQRLSAVRTMGYALALGDLESWEIASALWVARLSDDERVALAWAALKALEPKQAREVFKAALSGAGGPDAALFSVMDQAAFWADMAEAEELEAYCLASFNRMAPGRQAAFLDHVQER